MGDGLGGIPAGQPPLTTPLERRDIPPQLSMTLEHIVGQLDVLTQVCYVNIIGHSMIFHTRGGVGGNKLTRVTIF